MICDHYQQSANARDLEVSITQKHFDIFDSFVADNVLSGHMCLTQVFAKCIYRIHIYDIFVIHICFGSVFTNEIQIFFKKNFLRKHVFNICVDYMSSNLLSLETGLIPINFLNLNHRSQLKHFKSVSHCGYESSVAFRMRG